ncbi:MULTISPECIES: acetamidase/formamidase family protein [unclassified Arthrobacter]|uniref:acetamidase/formamidase family protein n=1 Tax=unclassified Arthrobacter TaxID=235627 RepID=UPI003FA3ADE8
MDYLTKFGYSPGQAHVILGAVPIEGRLSGVVDIPLPAPTGWIQGWECQKPVTDSP